MGCWYWDLDRSTIAPVLVKKSCIVIQADLGWITVTKGGWVLSILCTCLQVVVILPAGPVLVCIVGGQGRSIAVLVHESFHNHTSIVCHVDCYKFPGKLNKRISAENFKRLWSCDVMLLQQRHAQLLTCLPHCRLFSIGVVQDKFDNFFKTF